MIADWLRLFRIVNLPTVPGDVLAGAAACLVGAPSVPALPVVAACVAACGLYLFGLVDNDIVGAPTDTARPIPEGRITLRAARLARGACLFVAFAAGALANLPPAWWIAALALAVAIALYNRTKNVLLMGLCRGQNVVCGGAAVGLSGPWVPNRVLFLSFAVVWTSYIAAVTWYSADEEADPEKRRRVGLLIGALVYLQLVALLVAGVKPLLVAGAVMLVLLRLAKRAFPTVSAS